MYRDEMFYRIDENGNAVIFYLSGENVTTFDEHTIYPIDSDVSCCYDHPDGIILTIEDARKLEIPSEDEI